MAQKPSIPKGTRDFNPEQVAKRNYIFQTIRNVFETYGFQPIETPSFENSDTLMGKYGEEGDRLIFKILNSGDFVSKFSHFFINRTLKFFEANLLRQLDNTDGRMTINEFLKAEQEKSDLYQEDFFDNVIENDFYLGEKIFDNNYITTVYKFLVENRDLVSPIFDNVNDDFIEFKGTKKELATNFAEAILAKWIYNYPNKFSSVISEKALRYDLTVPFARYVVQHQNEIEFPFKRYQITSGYGAVYLILFSHKCFHTISSFI